MKRVVTFLGIILCTLIAGVYLLSIKPIISIGSFSDYVIKEKVLQAPAPPQEKEAIVFVGDVMLARNVENIMRTYGYMYPFASLPKLSAHSFLVGNFEASIPTVHVPTKSMTFAFSVNPLYIQGLQEYGFTHMSLANNHSYDFGVSGYKNAFTTLSEASLEPFGDQRAQASSTIRFLDVNDATVSLVGLYAVDVPPSQKEIQDLLTRAAAHSDVQVVYVHWGTEYELKHNSFQEKLAMALVDAGADVIIGHHPHVVQDIGIYKNVPIFYSLGNFIFDQYFSDEVQKGLALELSITETDVLVKLVPITSIGSKSQSRMMAASERDAFLLSLAKRSDTELKQMIQTGEVKLLR